MKILIKDLDPSLRKELPLTLQIEKSPVDISQLPIHVQYLLRTKKSDYLNTTPYVSKDYYDVYFKISEYQDLQVCKSKKETVIEYIRNYLLVPRGTYPFDPTFGNRLKQHLHTRDTYLRNTLLNNELKMLVDVINTSFDIGVTIVSSKSTPVELEDQVHYYLDVVFSIEEDTVTFSLQ
jgi:hypothetical protein